MSDDVVDPSEAELPHLFTSALEARRGGRVEEARDLLKELLRREPRLPEPHLELAHIHLEAGRVEDGEGHAREALRLLEAGGQWVEDVSEEVLRALAHTLVGEALRRRADADEVVFGDADVFARLLAESRRHFDEARRLDPDDAYADHQAFYLGLGDLEVELDGAPLTSGDDD